MMTGQSLGEKYTLLDPDSELSSDSDELIGSISKQAPIKAL